MHYSNSAPPDDTQAQAERVQHRRKLDGWFLKGPIPGPWLHIASALPGKSLHVALAIWFLCGLKKSNEVQVTKKARRNFNILPDAYRRGLKHLEDAGLVRVKRMPGRCHVVTVLSVPPKKKYTGSPEGS